MPGELAMEQTQEAPAEAEKKEPPASKPMVGIIYPPPEVRNIVDKTADFVARNGPEFAERIKLNEAGNPKFNFLNSSDPYNAYYQHKIVEIQEGVVQEQLLAASQQGTQKAAPKVAPIAMVTEPEPPKEPPPEWEYMTEPPSISGLELDIVKLTAQFVARNGAQFLDKLMMREQRNYMFDFLRKQHPLFTYFTKLVEQYSKTLIPPHEMMRTIQGDIENPFGILDRVQNRVEWEQFLTKQRRKVEEKELKERTEYAQVDWHDFILVETINFGENEGGYLPPPIRPTQLAQRLLQQQKYERMADEGGEVQEIEMEVEEQETEETTGQAKEKEDRGKAEMQRPPRPPSPPPPPSAHPSQPEEGEAKGVQIRPGYNPKMSRPPVPQAPPTQQFLISPITGEKIPADKMQEHMRYGLLDPRWVEQQKQRGMGDKAPAEVFAEGVQIGSSLKHLAERRTDIFGVEETIIGMKIGEEPVRKPVPTVQWDGHSASADVAHRQAQASITREQIEASQKHRGLIPDREKERIGPSNPSLPPSLPPPRPPQPAPPLPPSRPPTMSRPPQAAPSPHPLFSAPPPQFLPQSSAPHRMPPPPGMGGMQPMRPLPIPGGPGLLPTPPHGHPLPHPPSHPGGPPGIPPPSFPPHHLPPHAPLDIAPPVAKRPRTEAEELIPEQEFIAKNPGSVTFRVHVPVVPDRQEWKLNGQIFTISLPITDPVSVIKAKVADELGMPTGKQKLQIGTIFIKDSNSLGFYNISKDTVVNLGLKERGGRRK